MNNTNTSVSIIIPAYNSAHCISTTLDSVLKQDMEGLQIIVVDDGSTDETRQVVEGYPDQVTYIYQENAGQGAARNQGLQITSGKYIAFLDADDFWKPGFLKTCVSYLEENPDVDAVSTLLITRYADGREEVLPKSLSGPNKPQGPIKIDAFFDFWAEHDHIRTGSNLIRKSLIDKAGGQRGDLRVSQDLEYWAYVATFGKWAFVPEPLWVGNSRTAAIGSGWLKKYEKRRRLCPTVESWESRVVPRLKDGDRAGFEKVRGRVALGYAHNKLLGGAPEEALEIVRKYGASMPSNRVSQLMTLGSKWGPPGWKLACFAMQRREALKDYLLRRRKNKSPQPEAAKQA